MCLVVEIVVCQAEDKVDLVDRDHDHWENPIGIESEYVIFIVLYYST